MHKATAKAGIIRILNLLQKFVSGARQAALNTVTRKRQLSRCEVTIFRRLPSPPPYYNIRHRRQPGTEDIVTPR